MSRPELSIRERQKAWLERFFYFNQHSVKWRDATYVLNYLDRIETDYYIEQMEMSSEYQYAENWEQEPDA